MGYPKELNPNRVGFGTFRIVYEGNLFKEIKEG